MDRIDLTVAEQQSAGSRRSVPAQQVPDAGPSRARTLQRDHAPAVVRLPPAAVPAARTEEGATLRTGRLTVEQALEQVARATAPPVPGYYRVVKRSLDVLLASLLLLLVWPLMLLLAALIRLDSPGPAVFRQVRVGEQGRLFAFYKFRTMYADARTRCPELYRYDYAGQDLEQLYFKLPYDPRCTRVGRRLRRTSLDELPNLLNVLRGDMSLVGPRPEIPEMLPMYSPAQLCKFAVPPGLTGLAQIGGRNILRFVETNAKDVSYVHQRSLALDLRILLVTVGVVVLMIGAH